MYRKNAAAQINTTDYTDPQPQLDANGIQTERRIQEEESRQVSGRGKCKNAVFQYNELF